jgi:hypothetical protein
MESNAFMRLMLIIVMFLSGVASSCSTLSTKVRPEDSINLPFMKNVANECYYLDEYMPVPESLVKGKNGPLNLRYYTYRAANYKGYKNQDLVLTFYSQDEKCWSLFEEYLVGGWNP